MARPPFPTDVADITPDWLRRHGIVGHQVTAVDICRIGTDEGFSGCRLYRLGLNNGAGSLVAKLSPADPAMARSMAAANAREVAFYATHGQDPDLPLPRAHLALSDTASGASLLVLQDLGHDQAVPFGTGLGPEQARLALAALAVLHARWWDSPDLPTGPGLHQVWPFHSLWPAYLDRVASPLPLALQALGDRIAADPEAASACLTGTGPLTRIHGDAQADNLRFGKGPQARLIDWQMTGAGPGMADVGYLLISSLPPATRRSHEGALIAEYRAALAARGLNADTGIDSYLRAAAGKLWVTVAATLLYDNASAAKQHWRRIDLDRLAAFCADHDPAQALP